MKRFLTTLLSITLIGTLCLLAACAAPAAEQTGVAPALQSPDASGPQDELEAALLAAATVADVEVIMRPYVASGNYEAQMRCADRMLEIDPGSEDAWYAKAQITLLRLAAEQNDLIRVVTDGMEKVDDPQGYAERVKQYARDSGVSVELPFVHDYASEDEINTYGVSSANYYNGSGVHGEWQNGLLTSQGDWVYFTVPAEDYAIYKMRARGEGIQRLGEDSGCCINVVGDWIYYCNISEDNRIFRMRTDGSERAQVSEDSCKYMAVCGEWIVYANRNENDSLYRMKLDGSARAQVAQDPVMYPYLYGGRIYFRQRDERSFYSIAPDGSDRRLLAQYIEGYCIDDDWIYYITDAGGMVVEKVRPDGGDVTPVYRFAGKGGYALYTGGGLIVNDSMENSGRDQAVAVDLGTMKQTLLVDDWCEAFYIAGGTGYYLDYEEGNAWYYVDLASGETGRMESHAAPSDQDATYALAYEQIGFSADIANAVCVYDLHEPHDMRISIHKPEWGKRAKGWNIEFVDSDVNGYRLRILYFAEEGRCQVCLEKDGAEYSYYKYPATDEVGGESPDIKTSHQAFNAAFGTKEKELYHKPLAQFEQLVQERFGMSIEELYALPTGE